MGAVRIPMPSISEMLDLMSRGMSYRAMAAHYGVSDGTIWRWMGAHNLRKNRGVKRPPRDELEALRSALTLKEIADKYDTIPQVVSKWVKHYQLPQKGVSKMTPHDVELARGLRALGATYFEIADKFEVSQSTAHYALNYAGTGKRRLGETRRGLVK